MSIGKRIRLGAAGCVAAAALLAGGLLFGSSLVSAQTPPTPTPGPQRQASEQTPQGQATPRPQGQATPAPGGTPGQRPGGGAMPNGICLHDGSAPGQTSGAQGSSSSFRGVPKRSLAQ
jgi:hypothetical protein